MSATISADESVRLSLARDASGLERIPEGVARPSCEAEVVEVLRHAAAEGLTVTTAGGQTSTTGASITDRGILLSLAGLARIGELDVERRTVRVQPGVRLGDLKRALAPHGLLFPPDPTSEEDATVGGAIACNASGARSLRYGTTRPHVRGLRVALASGEVIDVRRSGLEKNTVGYALAQEAVDWFVGSEGTLGVILEAELALVPLPARVTGLGIPFATESDALAFVVSARESAHVAARCLEFFDGKALGIAGDSGSDTGPWPSGAAALVYAEQESAPGDDPPLDAWLDLAERHRARTDDVVVLEGEGPLRAARRMRHAVPATMNERGASLRAAGGRKVSTDWAVPYRRLAEAIAGARRLCEAAGLEQPAIYGHAGNGHPHQNFLARDAVELQRIEQVVEQTLRHVIALAGTVAAEHGIGKIKRRWLHLQLSDIQIGVMRAVKRELDPRGMLAPGNIFEVP